jgi:hypothetical protein
MCDTLLPTADSAAAVKQSFASITATVFPLWSNGSSSSDAKPQQKKQQQRLVPLDAQLFRDFLASSVK